MAADTVATVHMFNIFQPSHQPGILIEDAIKEKGNFIARTQRLDDPPPVNLQRGLLTSGNYKYITTIYMYNIYSLHILYIIYIKLYILQANTHRDTNTPKIMKVMNCIFKWISKNKIFQHGSASKKNNLWNHIEFHQVPIFHTFLRRIFSCFFSWVALMRSYTDADPHAFIPFVQQWWQCFFKLLSYTCWWITAPRKEGREMALKSC